VLIVTWNVNSLKVRLPRVLELLELHRPDVVCLQETKVEDSAFPESELATAGYQSVHHSAGRWNGVAVVARKGLEVGSGDSSLPGVMPAATEEARFLAVPVAGLRVASVYVPNGREPDAPAFAEKLAFLDALRARAADLDVIVGDFNVAPADADVYDPAAFVGATHVTDAERSQVAALLDAGFVDAHRRLHPEPERVFTWWDYRQGHFHRGLGMRIDLALVRSELAAGLRSCAIDRNFRKGSKPSDHAPLLVELDVVLG
jgi:exodeoxyribonuclease-3